MAVIKEFTGGVRRAGTDEYQPPAVPYRNMLTQNGFQTIADDEFPTPWQWSMDSLVGYLQSTSFASQAVLGQQWPTFEAAVRARLADYARDDALTETVRFEVIASRCTSSRCSYWA